MRSRGNSSGNGWTPPKRLHDVLGGLVVRDNRFTRP